MNQLPLNLQVALTEGRDDIVLFADKLLGMPLHDGQKKFLREAKAKVNILVPANRWGKAQPLSEPVLTPTGFKPMGDIIEGSEVITQDGSTTKVTAVYPQPKQKIFRLTFDDRSYAEVTGEHLWRVMTGNSRFNKNYNEKGKEYPNRMYQQWQTLSTNDILSRWGAAPSRYSAVVIPMVEPVEFPERALTIDPYVMGALLGDGSIKYSHVQLTSADQGIVDRIAETEKIASIKEKYAFSLYNMQSRLRQYGLMGAGSQTKFIPDDYLYNTAENRLALLRGLMDTDGSIETSNKAIEFSSCSPHLAEGVKFLVQSLGGKCRTTSRIPFCKDKDGNRVNGKLSYRLSIDIRVNPFHLERKRQVFESKKLFYKPHRILRTIEEVGEDKAQCITVAHPSQLYITRDFIVTHNSVTIAVKHIHHCFYKIGIGQGNTEAHSKASYQTVNLSPHSDTTKPVFEAILAIMNSSFRINEEDGKIRNNECAIGWFLNRDGVRNTTPLFIPFANNTSILFRSTGEDQGKSIEGRSYGYISYDEGGQSHHLEYEVKRRILPRLGELDGQLDIVSTPEMTSPSLTAHYKLFKLGGGENSPQEEGYYSQEGSITDNIFFLRANPNYVEQMLSQYRGDPIVDQVLYGKFVFSGDVLYPIDQIIEATDESLNTGIRYQEGHKYIIGVDTAMGEDEMVYTVIDVTDKPFKVVRQIGKKGNSQSPEIHANDFMDLVESYCKPVEGGYNTDGVKIILETFNGESANFYKELPQNLQGITYCWGSWQPPGIPANVATSHRRIKKAEILLALKKILANKELKIPNERTLIEQLSIYREDDKNLSTDRVISLAIATWLSTDGAPKQDEVELITIEDW